VVLLQSKFFFSSALAKDRIQAGRSLCLLEVAEAG